MNAAVLAFLSIVVVSTVLLVGRREFRRARLRRLIASKHFDWRDLGDDLAERKRSGPLVEYWVSGSVDGRNYTVGAWVLVVFDHNTLYAAMIGNWRVQTALLERSQQPRIELSRQTVRSFLTVADSGLRLAGFVSPSRLARDLEAFGWNLVRVG